LVVAELRVVVPDVDRLMNLRDKRLIADVTGRLSLDLSGLTVLTEAAGGNYMFTPLICAAAGCERVIAITRDSNYGTAEDVISRTLDAAKDMGLAGRIEILTDVNEETWASGDIVTNLGFLRPIDRAVVGKLKTTATIPIMFETWEFREQDLDLEACYERGICALGTNESHGAIKILDYLGPLVVKKLFENNVEVFGSKIVVFGAGKFFFKVCGALESMGAVVLRWLSDFEGEISALVSEDRLDALKGADALVIADSPNSTRCLIGSGGVVAAGDVASRCPEAVVIQLAGSISREELGEAGIVCSPRAPLQAGHMGWSLSELGPRPVIDLHAAGLKVGELMARARLAGLSPAEATFVALKHPISQDFSAEQRVQYGCPY
jgi:hypothetical protein